MRNFKIMSKVLFSSKMKKLRQNSYKFVIDLNKDVTYEASKKEKALFLMEQNGDDVSSFKSNLRKPKSGVRFSNLGGKSGGGGTADVSSILVNGRENVSSNHADESI